MSWIILLYAIAAVVFVGLLRAAYLIGLYRGRREYSEMLARVGSRFANPAEGR